MPKLIIRQQNRDKSMALVYKHPETKTEVIVLIGYSPWVDRMLEVSKDNLVSTLRRIQNEGVEYDLK